MDADIRKLSQNTDYENVTDKNKINKTGSETAVANLFVYGGEAIRASMRAIRDYKTKPYVEIREALDAEYMKMSRGLDF